MIQKIKQIIKWFLKKFKLRNNLKQLEKAGKHIKSEDLIKDLKKMGIKEGDVVLVHSSLKSIGYVEGGANTVINTLLKVIGYDGTLVLPTYSMKGTMYNTCISKNYVFDIKKSDSILGAIPSAFLKRGNISRSIHPTHSISAIGKYAQYITETHHIGNKTFGENSPWAKLIELNGKILGIGITLGPTTQYHYIEDLMGENFPLKVKDDNIYKINCIVENGEYIQVDVQPLDPEVAKTRIDKKESSFIRNYFWEIYYKLGVLKVGNIGLAKSWQVNSKSFIDILIKLAKIGITIYSTERQLKNNNLYPFDLIKDRLK